MNPDVRALERNSLTGVFYVACLWITRLVYVNTLWILFTLLGICVLGFAPATAALFSVIRKWILGQQDFAVWRTFWLAYKREFMKANVLGWGYGLFIVLLYNNIQYYNTQSTLMTHFLWIVSLFMLMLSAVSLFYLFPVLVHYQLKIWQYVRSAMAVSLAFPLHTLLMVAGLLVFIVIFTWLPGLLVVFSMSVPAVWIMKVAAHAFQKVEQQQAQDHP
ncbi:putative membrane protein YesL [Caldalkalibacillus uzonensis]|uniref:Membrane protein YesL n=1 Tax=Caldalkalibacillus uzonensis TaxID=353224 RepID=A0ABU0CQ96_9BACI|nr:YesL family protein [Caldalkalibacillus uzonensis]MDQ0338590.1 putative membrane protein YesL [Caldalkalibacillus uzonensis]